MFMKTGRASRRVKVKRYKYQMVMLSDFTEEIAPLPLQPQDTVTMVNHERVLERFNELGKDGWHMIHSQGAMFLFEREYGKEDLN